MNMPWHARTVADAAAALAVDPDRGLAEVEAAARLARDGPNTLAEARRKGLLRLVLEPFADVMIVVLLIAAVVSGLIGDPEDAVVVIAVVVLNAFVGFVQGWRAERALASLRRLGAARATVLRGGAAGDVPAATLVAGDVVLLEAGDVVPADLRLATVAGLRVDEAALTGESVPVEKSVAPIAVPDPPLGDRHDLAFKGTVVTYGRARGLVVATGMATEIGRIAHLLAGVGETTTPLQRRLGVLGQRLAMAAAGVCVVIFAVGLLRGEPPLLMFMTALSVAVAAIPEALPVVVTVLLALGAQRMVQVKALARRLPAVETLGSVSVIGTDKTGTLTLNDMRVEAMDPRGEAAPLLRAMALCNDTVVGEGGRPVGDPTETALWRAAAEAGSERAAVEASHPRLAELPFDAERKRMTTLHRAPGGMLACVKGAPESVIPRCADGGLRDDALARAQRMAADGLRVLAFAERMFAAPPDLDPEAIEHDLRFLGLVGLLDPPRPEAAGAIAACREAGIAVVMITGDHPATAAAIARRLGIGGDAPRVVTGAELARMDDAELRRAAPGLHVVARVDPAQKIRVIEALRATGAVVAMTGDGVNDAPALARADIGVAMGRSGTDVARDAAGLVLLDDNIGTVVAAVREGRRIYDNIRKFVSYAVTCNAAEVWTILLAPLLGLPMPLLPIHILWINLVTDGLPGLAFAAEPAEPDAMRRPPRPRNESLFAGGLWQHVVWVGLLMAGVTLATEALALGQGLAHWQTMVFTVLSLAQMAQAMAVRSEHRSLFRQGIFSNMPLLGAVALTVALQLLAIYAPLMNRLLDTQPLSAGELGLCLELASVVFAAVEIEKGLRGLGQRTKIVA